MQAACQIRRMVRFSSFLSRNPRLQMDLQNVCVCILQVTDRRQSGAIRPTPPNGVSHFAPPRAQSGAICLTTFGGIEFPVVPAGCGWGRPAC